MIHTPIILSILPASAQRVIETSIMLSGAVVFAVLAYASIALMLSAWETGEYFGEGALRVPTVYTRAVIVAMSAVCALAYLLLALAAARGRYSMLAGSQPGR
jgi:TRAP-type C4-dicarboxylate transport system permease small subunit